jgi:hypothetical protein
MAPLVTGKSQGAISQNISELHGGKTFAKTSKKFGKKKANAQAIAIALSQAKKSKGKSNYEAAKKKTFGIKKYGAS